MCKGASHACNACSHSDLPAVRFSTARDVSQQDTTSTAKHMHTRAAGSSTTVKSSRPNSSSTTTPCSSSCCPRCMLQTAMRTAQSARAMRGAARPRSRLLWCLSAAPRCQSGARGRATMARTCCWHPRVCRQTALPACTMQSHISNSMTRARLCQRTLHAVCSGIARAG